MKKISMILYRLIEIIHQWDPYGYSLIIITLIINHGL